MMVTVTALLAFVLPLSSDSLPQQNVFTATTFEEVDEMFKQSKKATSAYIYVAQAMSLNVLYHHFVWP